MAHEIKPGIHVDASHIEVTGVCYHSYSPMILRSMPLIS